MGAARCPHYGREPGHRRCGDSCEGPTCSGIPTVGRRYPRKPRPGGAGPIPVQPGPLTPKSEGGPGTGRLLLMGRSGPLLPGTALFQYASRLRRPRRVLASTARPPPSPRPAARARPPPAGGAPSGSAPCRSATAAAPDIRPRRGSAANWAPSPWSRAVRPAVHRVRSHEERPPGGGRHDRAEPHAQEFEGGERPGAGDGRQTVARARRSPVASTTGAAGRFGPPPARSCARRWSPRAVRGRRDAPRAPRSWRGTGHSRGPRPRPVPHRGARAISTGRAGQRRAERAVLSFRRNRNLRRLPRISRMSARSFPLTPRDLPITQCNC